MNFILDTDSYKLSHFLGYPADAEQIYSYAESRGGQYPATVFFGLQKFVRELAQVRVTMDDVYEAAAFAKAHGTPFNEAGWTRIVDYWSGRIPVIIKAAPEGSLIPTHNVLVTVENLDYTMPWLTSYIETALLRATWYPTTVATRIFGMKQRIKPFYDTTSDTGDMGFSVLDFSARGCSSRETAEIGGMAHLLSFMGSDNIPAVLAARKFYDEPMAAFSVAATEHSVTTSYGRDGEDASIDNLIENMMPQNGILSMVADTWNVYEFIKKIAARQDKIANKGGTVVIRPDSGKMRDVLPHVFTSVRDLFWANTNSKGFRVPKYVKILQGDGINENTVTQPFQIGKEHGISSDAIMTGSGGGLMQANIDRDTCRFAFKASNVIRAGIDYAISKDPITDPGKRSKAGRMKLIAQPDPFSFITMTDSDKLYHITHDELRVVYNQGVLYNEEDLATIRKRLDTYL
jgi:nicotinamide phosphoribosyltransferase